MTARVGIQAWPWHGPLGGRARATTWGAMRDDVSQRDLNNDASDLRMQHPPEFGDGVVAFAAPGLVDPRRAHSDRGSSSRRALLASTAVDAEPTPLVLSGGDDSTP
jgi:hypothetical protein